MRETQNIEYKETWRDEYLKWICGFANAQSGVIAVGKDDNGHVCGISDSKKLMEDLPNKIRDVLGLIVAVNLHTESYKDWLEISVRPSTYPVNYKGEYHYRSGSTKQILKGNALTQFLLEKNGITWDSVPVDNLYLNDFYPENFDIFRAQALKSFRLDEKDLNLNHEEPLGNLGLVSDAKPNRAALMLFYQNPEKYINGAYIKIGFFETNANLRYWDEIHGSLLVQAEKTIDLLYTKYLKAEITYQGITRIETYPFPKPAIREAVYNAIVHKNYAAQIPIQISVYEDKLYIANDSIFPVGWTAENLMKKHRSKPFNPNIANGFFRAGLIEAWGRGIEKICESCATQHLPPPEYTITPEEVMVCFINPAKTSPSVKILELMQTAPEITLQQIANTLSLSKRAVELQVQKLRIEGFIERIGSDREGHWKVHK